MCEKERLKLLVMGVGSLFSDQSEWFYKRLSIKHLL